MLWFAGGLLMSAAGTAVLIYDRRHPELEYYLDLGLNFLGIGLFAIAFPIIEALLARIG
jgi:hypothetical protein